MIYIDVNKYLPKFKTMGAIHGKSHNLKILKAYIMYTLVILYPKFISNALADVINIIYAMETLLCS